MLFRSSRWVSNTKATDCFVTSWCVYIIGRHYLGAAHTQWLSRVTLTVKNCMENLVSIGIRSIFIDNMIFAYFLGMCSFLAISKKVKTAIGLGIAVVFVLGVTVPINWLIQNYVLNAGALAWLGPDFANIDLNFLQFIVFISVIAAIVQLTEMAVEKF